MARKLQQSEDKNFWKEVSEKYTSLKKAGKAIGCDATTVGNYFHKFNLSFKNKSLKNGDDKKIEEPIIVNLPKVNLREVKIPKNGDDEEIAILLTSDQHAGKITRSFNGEIFKSRIYTLFDSAMTIINLHRHMYPIRKLHIINLGDNCQGENPFQGSVISTVEMGARDQVTKLAVPIWNDVIGSFKQNFETVEFDGFAGNHGHDRLAPPTSSLDLLFYDILRSGIGQNKGININIHEQFADIININGFRFFCFHGDGIPCQQGVPLFAIDKKLKSWYIQFNGFDYACSGHFHKRHSDEIASKFEYFMNSTLVSDDEWALSKLGISSNPSQWLLGVHPRRGVTWRYALTVDDKYPQVNKNIESEVEKNVR